MTANNKSMHILLGALVCCGALSQTNCMQQKNLSQKYQNGLKWVQDDQQEGIPRTGNAQSFASNFMKKNWPKGKDSTAGTVEHDLANLHALIITKPDMFRFPKRQNSIYQQANANLVRALLFQQAQLDRLLVTLANERLFKAIAHNSPENVQVELDTGAQVNTRNERDDTPLNYACYSYRRDINTTEIVARLIRAGADVNARNRYKFTPLLQTCLSPDPEVVKLLLAGGAEPDTQDQQGNTPLSYVCEINNNEIAKLLLAAGAQVNLPNADGTPPIKKALNHGNQEIVNLLLSRQATAPNIISPNWRQETQTLLQAINYWANLQDNQQATPEEIDRLIQAPQNFIALLFRNGMIKKLKNRLNQGQRDILTTAFFDELRGESRQTYLDSDACMVAEELHSWISTDLWERKFNQMGIQFTKAYVTMKAHQKMQAKLAQSLTKNLDISDLTFGFDLDGGN